MWPFIDEQNERAGPLPSDSRHPPVITAEILERHAREAKHLRAETLAAVIATVARGAAAMVRTAASWCIRPFKKAERQTAFVP